MTLPSALVPLFTHFIPVVFFVFMAMDVLLRNRKRTEHLLVSAIIICCMLMFLEEFVRQLIPIEYSPMISVIWFSTAGISITGFGMHLFLKLTRLEHKLSRFFYPYICYLPIVLVLLNLLFNDQMISGNEFHQVGIWKLPVYNEAYYIAMIGSNVFNVFYLIILGKGKAKVGSREHRAIYNQLMIGVTVTAFFNLVIGLIDFKGYLPPYPYIYGGFAWCLLLRHTMLKYEFLNHIDKRYEKLFNLNPAAIMLMDMHGNVKEANPSAKHLFELMDLDYTNSYSILSEEIQRRVLAREEIRDCELTIRSGGKHIDVVIDGDYIVFDYDPHLILIIRDVTMQKESQREVLFLAYHDFLTRLPNRRQFYEKLDTAIQEASRARHKIAIVLFDLDYFKEINDQYGHHVGDRALLHLANAIRKVVVSEGTAARLGGDEFVFFLHPVSSAQAVRERIHQLHDELEGNPLIVENERIPIRLSIGVSFYPDNGLDGDALLNSADKALYHVKRNGRNDYYLLAE